MVIYLSFQELWDITNLVSKTSNSIHYHHCCDVWTTRGSAAKRASHYKSLTWRKLFSILGKKTEDKKQALLAKMTDEGWRLPAVLNEVCQAQPRQSLHPQSAFKPHQLYLPPQDLQASFSLQDSYQPRPEDSVNEPQGMLFLHQVSSYRRPLSFNSKPFKHLHCRL